VPRQAGGLAEVMQVYAGVDQHTQHRKLRIGHPPGQGHGAPLEIEEQLGESIALHIWDAAAAMMGLFERLSLFSPPSAEADVVVAMPRLEEVLGLAKGVRILELGCGVGVLGLGIGKLLGTLPRRQGEVLLTDLPAAEETAKANIARWVATQRGPEVAYANLDWESVAAGQEDDFLTDRGPWDLVMLSDCTYNDTQFGNLVSTLDRVHEVGNRGKGRTKVLLGTKPRHESEAKFFGMIQETGWEVSEQTEVPIKGVVGLNGETQHVRVFLYEKGDQQ
jgi:predicted nicotinamide N-methyase